MYKDCPYCEAEENGFSTGWGFSDQGWYEAKKRHDKEHVCPTCKQTIESTKE